MNIQQEEKIKYVVYARKSSERDELQALSIPSQLKELDRIIERDNLDIEDTKQEAHSSKAPGRPVFNEMLDEIEKGKVGAKGIIAWDPSRLSRNSVDTGRLIYLLDLKKILEIITPTQVFRNTPYDKFMLNLFCSQAKLENDNKGVAVKRGMKTKAELGWYPGKAYLGYLNNKFREIGEDQIIVDPERFEIIEKMFRSVLEKKWSIQKAYKTAINEWGLTNKKGKKLGQSHAYRIFRNPFYFGLYEWPQGSGFWHKGLHKPMIEEKEFYKIQEILDGRKMVIRNRHQFEFTKMIKCGECFCSATADSKIKRQKNGNVHHYTYYHCSKRRGACSQKSIEEKVLEKQIIEKLETITISPKCREVILEIVKRKNEEFFETNKKQITRWQKEKNECKENMKNLIKMRAKEEITKEQFDIVKNEEEKEEIRLKALLDDADNNSSNWIEKMEQALSFAEKAKEKFETGDTEDRRTILSSLSSDLILKDKKLFIDVAKPLLAVKKMEKLEFSQKEMFRPLETSINKRETGHIDTQFPIRQP